MAKPKVSTTPAVKVLPPTTEAFDQNVRRAHIQTAIWKSAALSNPPAMDPTKFGWERDELSRTLVPRMMPPNTGIAPPEVLQMIRCGCSSETPCYTSHCRCTAAKLPCTVSCACRGEMCCKNERTLPAAVMGLPCTVFCACRGEMCCKNERTLPAAVMMRDDGSVVE